MSKIPEWLLLYYIGLTDKMQGSIGKSWNETVETEVYPDFTMVLQVIGFLFAAGRVYWNL